MAHVLNIYDGSTTVNLLDECGTSPWVNLEDGGLNIGHPPKKQTWSGGAAWRQGRTLSQHAYENRTITMMLEIGGATWDAVFDQITELNRILSNARESQLSKLAADVELRYQLDTVSSMLRFDVVDGDLVTPENLMSVEGLGWTKCSGNHKVMKGCMLTLTCKPFARATENTLVNGASIKNSDDASNNNYVSWSASAVDGDVAGPLRIRHERNYATGDDWGEYWVGLRDTNGLSTFMHVLEAEDYDQCIGTPTTTGPNSKYSDDYCEAFSSVGGSGDAMVLRWDIAQTSVPMWRYMGKFRALLIGENFGTSTLWKIKMKYKTTVLREYPWRKPSSTTEIIDLGVIEMPPWDIREDQDSGEFSVELWMYATSSQSFNVDALYFMPAEDYKFRWWKWRGWNQDDGDIIEDIGRFDQVHFLESDQYPVGILDWKGLPLYAMPDRDARLYFILKDATGGTHNAEFASTISVYHTPYYLNINRGAD